MNRRQFVQSSAAAAGMLWGIGCAREAEPEPAAPEGMTLPAIGLQLYTVREHMEADFEGTIRRVADLGYKELEFAGYFDRDPADIRGLLGELGLAAPSGHIPIEALRDGLAGALESASALGHSYIVCPWIAQEERTLEHYRQHAALFNEVGAAAREAGIQFAYHNHEFEFEDTDGVIPYDLLLAETDPDLVKMELDLYWIRVAAKDTLAYFALHPGRFPLCHVKDMAADGSMAAVGAGEIDFAPIFAASEGAGLAHYFVEHDHPDDAFASVTASIAHLTDLRY